MFIRLINMEVAAVTPPVGFNLYIMKGIVKEQVSFADITRGAVVFVVADVIVLALMMAFPQIVLWLPNTMMK